MGIKNILFAASVLLLLVSSCKPFYECGQAKPEKKLLVSKRVRTVIEERDYLCKTVEKRDQEIVRLKTDISDLKKEIAGLTNEKTALNQSVTEIEKKYNDLMSQSLSQSEQFNLALKQKTEELAQKERLLQEREMSLDELRQVISRQDSITKRLNDVLRNALLGFQTDELSVEVKNGKVYVSMSDKLLFKSGSAAVEAKGKDALKALSDVLLKNPEIDILVEGHTDNIPIKTAIYRDNWDLSVARATSIVRILTDEHKIEPIRLTASGKGEYSPKALNDTPEGRASNRRTEIILSPKLDEVMNLLKAQ